jgi:hypothetical protein
LFRRSLATVAADAVARTRPQQRGNTVDAVSLSPEERLLRRDWGLFTALTFLFGFGFAVYMGVFQNFLRDDLRVSPLGLGQLESLREVPGLLAA